MRRQNKFKFSMSAAHRNADTLCLTIYAALKLASLIKVGYLILRHIKTSIAKSPFSAHPRSPIGGNNDSSPSVDAPFQARENVGVVLRVVGCCHLSGL
jgi:hypothetical protein